ncbi:MAG: NAD kinase [Holosporales bacterium]
MKLHFVASHRPQAQHALDHFLTHYGQTDLASATVIVALGGDGFMLRTLQRHLRVPLPVYGINYGSVGFLMNRPNTQDLERRVAKAQAVTLYPLKMQCTTLSGEILTAHAFNEVALLRRTHMAARLRIRLDQKVHLEELVADGILVATPAGSTAYNYSAMGPILPLSSNGLALTPISPFRPRRWRGAVVPDHLHIEIEVNDGHERRVNATADFQEFHDVERVIITKDTEHPVTLLFDPGHSLDERILREQFLA